MSTKFIAQYSVHVKWVISGELAQTETCHFCSIGIALRKNLGLPNKFSWCCFSFNILLLPLKRIDKTN